MTSGYDVFAEHEHIRHLVDRVEAWIERRASNGSSWLPELRTRLEQLNADLGPHFRGEESILFQDVSGRIPRLAPTVQRLVEQHRRMEKDFAQIVVDVQNIGEQEPVTPAPVVEQLAKALRLLKVHEQQETELILSAYGQDLGEPL